MNHNNIVEEYNVVYDNYKLTFSHTIEVIKYYSGTVVVVTGGIMAKITSETQINSISVFKGWVLFILGLFILLGFIGIVLLVKIQRKRKRCILQLNFLRKIMFQNLTKDIFNQYNMIAGYSTTITKNKVRLNPSYYLPITVIVIIIIFLTIGFIYIMNYL